MLNLSWFLNDPPNRFLFRMFIQFSKEFVVNHFKRVNTARIEICSIFEAPNTKPLLHLSNVTPEKHQNKQETKQQPKLFQIFAEICPQMDVDEAVQSICESTVSSGTGFKSWSVAWGRRATKKCNSFWRHFQCSLLLLIA